MKTTTKTRAVAAGLATLIMASALSSCAVALPSGPADPADPEDWVVVTFGNTDDRFDLETMDALLETELAADEALQAQGAGWIDGNEIGDNVYELYFVGHDSTRMWQILEPIFGDAPVAWSRVELRSGFEDAAPTVLER